MAEIVVGVNSEGEDFGDEFCVKKRESILIANGVGACRHRIYQSQVFGEVLFIFTAEQHRERKRSEQFVL